MRNRTMTMLAESGLIPKETIEQFIKWRLAPPELLEAWNTRPVESGQQGLMTDSERAFVTELSKSLNSDDLEMRQTLLDDSKHPVVLRVQVRGGDWVNVNGFKLAGRELVVPVDQLLSDSGRIRKIRRVEFDGARLDVLETTALYEDEELASFLLRI